MSLLAKDKLLPTFAMALYWIAAIIYWWAVLWHADTFAGFGGDLPYWSYLVIGSTRLGLPFLLAAISTALTLYILFRVPDYTPLVSAWMLSILMAYYMVVTIGITSPMVRLCGEFVPGWPEKTVTEYTPGQTGRAGNKLSRLECGN